MTDKKGRIGILTGGGDIPGLNQAIRGVTLRALSEGFEVVGIRRGWAGLIELRRDAGADNSEWVMPLDRGIVERYAYAGGTFLHSSRTRPSTVPAKDVPAHLKDKYTAEKNDLTDEVIANLEFLGIDYLVPAGGDDTLSYGVELGRRGFPVVAIPKTMDNDVPGHRLLHGLRHLRQPHHRDGAPGHELGGLARAHRRARGVRPLRGLHGAAADLRRRRRPLRHPRGRVRHGEADGAAGRRPQRAARGLLGLHRQRGRHAGRRRDGLHGRREGHVRPRQARRHRPEREQQGQGTRPQVQRRQEDRHDQHEPQLPGAQRRARTRSTASCPPPTATWPWT